MTANTHPHTAPLAPVDDRNALRRKLRKQRASLTPKQLVESSLRASTRVTRIPQFKRAKRIAGFIASNGELDPLPALLSAHASGKQCYLPRLHPFLKGRMWFITWKPGDPLESNRFGIPEPKLQHRMRTPNWMLNMVLVPLVAFDAQLNRMGMGQGFYDRAFSFTRHRKQWKGPFLCGFAHAFQQAAMLSSHSWDVPLDTVVTETQIIDRHTSA